MAKVKGAKLTFEVTDDGSLKLLSGKLKQTKKDVDNLSRSEHTLNRNFKGASQQSSNTTKNFSKMAQGITGGLVPAYATLAANIFAISAAFRFLQSAADLRILQQGQLEYAQRTGQSLSILTRQLQLATGGQLAFAEAAQSVAIATAAGLSAKQINALGDVAKKASLALGRDLTDSFNRLVRGSVKAEPELLDELGIILRLDTATEKYALTIGKNAKQLNIFEKSQAVVNEVLAQGVEKFGETDTAVNSLTKLAKGFDDLVNSIKRAIGPIAEFTAVALSQNTTALAGAGILLGRGLLTQITPNIPKLGGGEAGLKAAEADFAKMYGGTRDISSLGTKDFSRMQREMNAAYARAAEGKIKSVYRVEQFTRQEAQRSLQRLKVLKLEEEAMNTNFFNRMILQVRATYATYRTEHGRTMSFIKTTGVVAGRIFTGALSLAGYVGVAISLVGVLGQLLDKSSETEKAYRTAQKEIGNLFQNNAEDLAKTISGLKTYDSLLANALQSARALSNIDFSQIAGAFTQGAGETRLGGRARRSGFLGYKDDFANFLVSIPGISSVYQQAGMMGETASAGQMQALGGLQSIVTQFQTLTVEGSKASQQLALMESKLKGFIEALQQPGDKTELFKDIQEFITYISENGTIASEVMKNLGSTTQIMTSSAADFSKALNSFKTPQTQLTRLTTNIEAVGSAMTGLSGQFAKGQVALRFKEGGGFFDEATMSMLKTFLGEDQLKQMKVEEAFMSALVAGGASDERITAYGSAFIEKYGKLVEEEAKRLHGIEMGMITDRIDGETALLNVARGRSPLVSKHLQDQQKLVNLQTERANIQIIIDELESKGIEKDAAQIEVEQGKLRNLNEKILTARRAVDQLKQVGDTFASSFESNMATAFQSIIDGSNNMKDAFGAMAKAILNSLAQILAQQAAMNIMMMLPTGFTNPFGRDGGIMSAPGYRSFSDGGISSGSDSGYLATLHGTEAVVPLPNGRSIPVELSGGSGMGGNVTVNVNMTTGETSMTGDSAFAMGRAISQAVQKEISKQQQPGGSLSPY